MVESEAIRKDFYKLGKFITTTYFSNLKFKLKNDCICRAIAEYFPKISSASILLYDALTSTDRLASYGHYMHPRRCKIRFKDNSDAEMLEHISVYEYLSYKFESNFSAESCTYADYKAHPCFYTNLKSSPHSSVVSIDEESKFKQILDSFFTIDPKDGSPLGYKKHQRYKEGLSTDDIYPLNDIRSPSPRFFEASINQPTSKAIIVEKLEYKDREELKLWSVCEHSLGMTLSEKAIYIGFRLMANDRCIGILRLLSHYETANDENVDDVAERQRIIAVEDLENFGIEELIAFVDGITLHIGNSYHTDHLKSIDYSRQGTSYKQVCEFFKHAINCNGCILRTYNQDLKRIEIVGFTPNLNDYIKRRRKYDHFQIHSKLLRKLFQPSLETEHTVKSTFTLIGFQIQMNEKSVVSINYMYQSANGILHSTTNAQDLHVDFEQVIKTVYSPEVVKVIYQADLQNVLVMKLPFAEEAYLTFANSNYRPLILTDVEVLYPYITRLGMELHLKEERSKEIRDNSIRMICHDLRPMLGIIGIKADNIEKELKILKRAQYSSESLSNVITKLEKANGFTASRLIKDLTELANYHLKGYSFQKSLKERKLIPTSRAWDMKLLDRLVDYCRSYALDRKQIGITKGWDRKTNFPKINVNQQGFIQIFMSLMFNAVKFSDNRRALISKLGERFSPGYSSKTDGHIRVELVDDESAYGFSITNWGKRVSEEDIADLGKRDSEKIIDDEFESNELNPKQTKRDKDYFVNKSGNGLYYARLLAEQLDAELTMTPTYNEYKFSITVKWKR